MQGKHLENFIVIILLGYIFEHIYSNVILYLLTLVKIGLIALFLCFFSILLVIFPYYKTYNMGILTY